MKLGQIVYQGNTKTGADLLIRYPIKQDLRALWKYINTLSQEKTFIAFQGERVTLKQETDFIKTKLNKIKQKQAVFLLAFSQNQLIGVTEIELKDKVASHIGGFGISITKPYRHQGIGKLLMNLVIQESKQHLKGLKIITLEVFSNNKVGINLYQKLSFTEYGRLPQGIKHCIQFVDNLLMYKPV